jgi:hypothetical protein
MPVSTSPFPYLSPQSPLLHSGIIEVTGTLAVVDLGLGHNGFVPTVSMNKAVPGAGDFVAWTRGTKLGTFNIHTSGTMSISFTAIAGASVA